MRKRLIKTFMILITLTLTFVLIVVVFMRQDKFGKHPDGDRLKRIQQSPNYRDNAFHNQTPTPNFSNGANMFTVLREFLFTKRIDPSPLSDLPNVKTDLKAIDPAADVLVWFGHSSYFLQVDGQRILVDPVLSGAASPLSFTTRSFKGSDIYTTDDLPEVDLLIITHDHWDHLDYQTVKALIPQVTRVVCPLGVGAHLEKWGYSPSKVQELDWYEQVSLPGNLEVTATPARHFSGRGFKRNQTLWASFVLKSTNRQLYIGGDSGYGPHFAEIGKRFGQFDLVILENGQYDRKWENIHLLPEQVLQAAQELNGERLLPVHSAKFSLALHAWYEPLERLSQAKNEHGTIIFTPMIGEPLYLLDTTQVFSRWWTRK